MAAWCRACFAAFVLCVSLEPGAASAAEKPAGGSYEVKLSEIDDWKSVYGTVRSKDLIEARVRTPGTIASLKVAIGDPVTPGQVLALVADPKIALRIKALEAQLVALQSRLETARNELDRSQELKAKGVAPQARVDQAQTAFDVAENALKAARADRAVVETEISEGQVLAPATGRVLKVPVTEGSVVMAGESIATIAANDYLLRIEVPERHARFIKVGDAVELGARGLAGDKAVTKGKIVRVYPELAQGRVVADAEVDGLGSYFVGERVLTRISAGKRQAVVVPRAYVFDRFGLDYVRLVRKPGSDKAGAAPEERKGEVGTANAYDDVVVQTGQSVRSGTGEESIELLAGVMAGDTLVLP